MKRKKALRRHCDLTACGKLYRYSSSLSRTCSPSCRKELYLERKKAADQVAQEQNQAKADRRAAAMIEQTAERERQALAKRQPAPAPRPRSGPTYARAYPLAIHPHIASRAQAPDGDYP